MSFSLANRNGLTNQRKADFAFALVISLLLFVAGCTERVDVNAPPKDIWVVYGVLDPQRDVQDLRIGKAFQIEENAFTYAQTHDPAVKGLAVHLSGGGDSWEAIEIDSILKVEGDFNSQTSIYRFETGRSLQEGQKYTLSIGWPDDSSLHLSAETRIPPEPKLLSPQILGSFNDRCLMQVPFEDTVQVVFNRKQSKETSGQAYRFQLGIELNYTENDIPKQYRFGPTRLFEQNLGCGNVGAGSICYQFPAETILTGMRSRLNDPLADYAIDDDTLCGVIADLSRFLELKVTAIDTALGRYMTANDPVGINLNTYRREYTNIVGNASVVGIFGSINYHNLPIDLTDCGRYLLGLNPSASPRVCE